MDTKKGLKYYRHKIDNLLVISRIVTVHYLEFEKDFASEGEAHDFWEMVYVDRGELLCETDGDSLLLHPGDAVFHRPDEFHRHTASGRTSVFIISFECRSEGMRFFEGRRMPLPRELRRYIFAILSEATATFDIPVSDPLTKKMELQGEPALGGTQMIKNRLEMLLIMLLRQEMSRAGEGERFLRGTAPGDRLAETIIGRMKAGVREGLTVSELCEGIAYSRSYIFKEFRLATGRTIADYYNRMRIGEAKRLIREGEHSLSEIADLLSFDTPNYFGKTFKRYVGLTPRAWRSRHRDV